MNKLKNRRYNFPQHRKNCKLIISLSLFILFYGFLLINSSDLFYKASLITTFPLVFSSVILLALLVLLQNKNKVAINTYSLTINSLQSSEYFQDIMHSNTILIQEQTEKPYKTTERLNVLAQAITSKLSLEEIYNTIAEGLPSFMRVSSLTIAIIPSKENTIHILQKDEVKNLNFTTEYLDKNSSFYTIIKHLQSKNYLIRKDESHPTDYNFSPSSLYIPLKSKKRLIGIIALYSEHKNAYTSSEVILLQNLSLRISTALENTFKYQQVKKEKEEIEQTKELYQSLVESIPHGLCRKDIHGKYTFVNQAFLQKLHPHLTIEDILGKTDYALYPKEIAEIYHEDDKWVKENHKVLEGIRVFNRTSDQKALLLQMTKSPIHNFQKEIIGTQTFFSDVTKKQKNQDHLKIQKKEIQKQAKRLKKANLEIININTNLEKIIEERTREIQKTNQELDLFLYRSSHDLRRPLTTLMGLAEVAKLSLQDKESLFLFEKVNITAKNMDKMLNKLRMLSEIHHHNTPILLAPINLSVLLHKTLEHYHSCIKNKAINIQILTDSYINSNPQLLEIILSAILENAIFYAPFRSTVYIETNKTNKGVYIQIQDEGKGIPLKYQHKVFQMFFKGDRISSGNGLGLYIAKKAIQKIGGNIQLKSTENLRTTIRFWLPDLSIK